MRAMIITAIVAGSAKASMAGYDLLMAQVDSLFLTTYSSERYTGSDEFSASMRDSMTEINRNYQVLKNSSDATDGNGGTYKP